MFVVFDLETTGFSGSYDDVAQFSYIKFDSDNSVLDAGTLYFYYEGMSWSEDAYAVHGISQEFLKQYAYAFRENVIKMWTILSGANVVGHNNTHFDCPFARTWLARQGLVDLQFGIINDTMLAFRPMTHTSKVSLIKLCQMNDLTQDVIRSAASVWFDNVDTNTLSSHDATYDTTATALLALTALRKGYMSFETVVNISYDEVNTSDLLTQNPTMVDFKLKEPDGTLRVYTFGGHKMGNSIEFPGEFEYVKSNMYTQGPYTLCIGKEDTLQIAIGDTIMESGKDFDILDYTKKVQ